MPRGEDGAVDAVDALNWGSAPAPTHAPLSAPELDAYLARIGVTPGALAAASAVAGPRSLAVLRAVVRGHALSIPFESFDVTLREPVSLAPRDIFAKLVERRRGGFCLETSFLLRSALQALGFGEVLCLRAARVWLRVPASEYAPREPPIPRLHVVLVVRVDDAQDDFLVDVGFGGGGPPEPLPLRAGAVTPAAGDVFRTDAGDTGLGEDSWVLWAVQNGAWRRLYSFEHVSLDCPRVHAADFLSVSHYVQSGRGTLFFTIRVASMPLADGRVTLLKRELRRRGAERLGEEPAALEVTAVADAGQLRRLAREHFGIALTLEQAQVIFDADADA
jgi:arylamine N-acetyltransferase